MSTPLRSWRRFPRPPGYSESVYTKDSYAALTAAVEAAQKLLDGGQGSYSKKDVADATTKIEKAIDGLKMRPG